MRTADAQRHSSSVYVHPAAEGRVRSLDRDGAPAVRLRYVPVGRPLGQARTLPAKLYSPMDLIHEYRRELEALVADRLSEEETREALSYFDRALIGLLRQSFQREFYALLEDLSDKAGSPEEADLTTSQS